MKTPDEMRAEVKTDKAVAHAKRQLIDDVLTTVLDTMPDCCHKRNGQILLMTGRINALLDNFDEKASETRSKCFGEEQSQQVLDYLRCVHVGMVEFCKQIGLEV